MDIHPKTTAITARQEPGRLLSAERFQQLADVPAAMVWLANIDNPNTRRAYQGDVEAFVSFCGIEQPDELQLVTRAHVIAWRTELEAHELAPATIWRKLSAVSSLYDYLCNENAVEHTTCGRCEATRRRCQRRQDAGNL